MEEYVSRRLDQNIVDPDPEMIYTKRKLHRLSTASSGKSVGDLSAMASSSTPSPGTKWKPKIPSDGWGLSLEKAPLFTRAEMDKHIGQSGKHIGGEKHHSVPTGFRKAKTYLQDEYLHEIKTNYDQQYFYYRAKCFHSFKRNESPHNLIIALCLISGEVVFANCGPSCAAGKSGFCNHVLALMLKVCKYTLYNCKSVTELQHEADENCSTACTSTLQRWHQPRVEGILSYPIMEVSVSKTQLEGEHKSGGITCHLYEARRVDRKSKLNDFVEAVQNIDPTLGLVQTCELNTNDPVDTRFGESPTGAFGSYQLAFQESNFKVTSNLARIQPGSRASNSKPSYPSLPLDDLNDDFVLDLPDDLDLLQNKLLDELKVNMLDANKIEENTRDQHNCNAWTEQRRYRFTASNFGKVCRRKRNHEKFCNDMLDAKPFRSASTDHGIKYEAVALREYEKQMHIIGHPVKVERSGFFVSPKLFFLGCTPDGKVVDISCPEDQFGLVEIKCPSSKFGVTPAEACSDPHFYLEIKDGKPKLKKDHIYYDQVQGQMALTGAKWCDFVVYTSRGLSIERIHFDEEHWKKQRAILQHTYFRYFLPAAAKKKYAVQQQAP